MRHRSSTLSWRHAFDAVQFIHYVFWDGLDELILLLCGEACCLQVVGEASANGLDAVQRLSQQRRCACAPLVLELACASSRRDMRVWNILVELLEDFEVQTLTLRFMHLGLRFGAVLLFEVVCVTTELSLEVSELLVVLLKIVLSLLRGELSAISELLLEVLCASAGGDLTVRAKLVKALEKVVGRKLRLIVCASTERLRELSWKGIASERIEIEEIIAELKIIADIEVAE